MWAALVVGSILIAVSCVGCFGAVFNSRQAVLCFFMVTFVVLIGELFVVTFFYARMDADSVTLAQPDFKAKWLDFAARGKAEGTSDDEKKALRLFLADIQSEFLCCGYDDPDDPVGCDADAGACLQLIGASCAPANALVPCKDKLPEFVNGAMHPWFVGYVIFAVFQFLLLFGTCMLLCHIKPEAKDTAQYIGDYYQPVPRERKKRVQHAPTFCMLSSPSLDRVQIQQQ